MTKLKISHRTLTEKMIQGLAEQGFIILGRGSFTKATKPIIDYLNKCRLTDDEADATHGLSRR